MALTDTRPEAEVILARVYRLMSPGRKWLAVDAGYRSLRVLHAAGVRLRHPEASSGQILADWVGRVLNCPDVPIAEERIVDPVAMSVSEARDVMRVLQRLSIPYALGGSMASSIHGIPRATQDSDISVAPFRDRIAAFLASFNEDFYLSAAAIEDAHRNHSSFNIINTLTGFKTDLFVVAPGSFAEMALSRRKPVCLEDVPQEPINLVTPEDIILLKLRWYRLGNETLDRQWSDVLGVMKAQHGELDQSYLDQWARQLRVDDLLARARQESGL
jgi:hypothetical protein